MKTTAILVLAAVLLAPAAARANGYDVPNMGARDLALAGGAVADQVDAAAAIQNPAALARQPGLGLSVSAGYLDLRTKWTSTSPSLDPMSPDRTNYHPVPPPVIAASYGFDLFGRRAGVGAAFNVIAGGNMFWDDEWAGRGEIITVDRKLFGGYLTAGYEVLPTLRVGGGLVYIYSTEYLKQGIQPYPDAYGEVFVDGDGIGYDVSAEWTPIDALTIGVDYKHQVHLELEGDAHLVAPPALVEAAPELVDQGMSHSFRFPNQLHVGLAWRAMKTLRLLLAYEFVRYEVYDDDAFIGDAGFDAIVPRNYSNGHTLRLAAEWDATERLAVRGGVLRDLSGVDTAYYSPSLPDADTWVVSGGVGWKATSTLDLSAALYYAKRDDITSTGEAFPGTYETDVLLASIGVTWRPAFGAPAR